MHNASHLLLYCIALWCTINNGEAARSSVSPDILANFAKNVVASVLSPVVLGEVQSRNNRSSFRSALTESANLNNENLNSHSILDNIVDKASNAYYEPRSYPYNRLYEDSSEGLEGTEANERLGGFLRDDSHLRQREPNFYKSYDFSANNVNFDATPKPSDNIDSSLGNIQESSTNLYSSYHGGGFPKAAFPHGPFSDKPHGGFHGFGPYGHHHHHHHHPYGGGSSEDAGSGENAQAQNRTNYGGYGSPYFGHPYSPFPYGGYGNHDSFHGPYQRNGNNSSGDGRNGYGPYGSYHGGPDFYGPPGYGYNHGYGNNNANNNGNNDGNINSGQTEEPAGNGDQNNATKNGYSPPYGPPWVKPLLGTFPLHGFPSPFLPCDHFHGAFKGSPVVGVGPVGYPIYADPYLAGFHPFHHFYGPPFYGKKYLPKGKPADSGDSGESTTEAPAELSEGENPERITTLNDADVAPAPSSNRYKISIDKGRKELKRIFANFENRRD